MKGLRPRESPARADGGDAGRLAAPEPIEPRADRRRAVTPGADRCYDATDLEGATHERPADRRPERRPQALGHR